jgi:hypothetical protein
MKEIISKGIGEGKTTRCIELSAEHQAYIVCETHKEARRIFDMSVEMGLKIPFPITLNEFISGQFCGKRINGFIIDNVDHLLAAMARGVPVLAMSFTTVDREVIFDAGK